MFHELKVYNNGTNPWYYDKVYNLLQHFTSMNLTIYIFLTMIFHVINQARNIII